MEEEDIEVVSLGPGSVDPTVEYSGGAGRWGVFASSPGQPAVQQPAKLCCRYGDSQENSSM